MFKKLQKMNKERQAETAADSCTNVKVPTSSLNAAKPHVGCCTSMETAMQGFIKSSVAIRELNPLQDVMPTKYYQETLLSKEKQQILDAFRAGIISANYSSVPIDEINDNANEYFNNTFKN
jgi:hypothetical protein